MTARSFHTSAGNALRHQRGSSLLLVLWAIMLMAFAVIGLVDHLSRSLDESIEAEKDFRARLLLDSARTLAAHPALERGDPLLRQQVSATSSYEVTLTTEGTRIALNQLAGSAPLRGIAGRLFEQWGLDSRQAETLVESIADWTDGNSRQRPQGAEKDYYTAQGHPDWPFNQPFQHLDDVLLVRGADEMDRRRPDWRDHFTLYGDGTIDMHLAPPALLEAVFDVSDGEVSRFTRARLGPDGLPDTKDDRKFASISEIRSLVDAPEANWRRVLPVLTLSHPIRRVECVGRVANHERRLTILEGGGLHLVRED